MGDVILLLPVLKGVLDANADVDIYLLTQSRFFPLFQNIKRLYLIEADLKGQHSGTLGLINLYRKISLDVRPDVVIDMHCVVRTYFLDMLFRISGFRVINFSKGTFRKKLSIRSKSLEPLPSTIDRYSAAFIKAGFKINLPEPPVIKKTIVSAGFGHIFNQSMLIGIAPFAMHKQKVWGIDKVEKLIAEINKTYDSNIVLFGGGISELEILNMTASKFPNCIVSANHFSFTDELELIPMLAVMVSMDSANMHLASMAGVPTISIWGATHPALGFAPYRQPDENMIQYNGDKLSCRPCSVYGNKKCIYSDGIRCMEYIPVDTVLQRIHQILSDNLIESIQKVDDQTSKTF